MDGWVILDKDSGLFSRTAGGRVARMFGAKKFGHIGTLDAMASGVLPIAIGRATKMIPFLEDVAPSVKEYEFGVLFGFETDTLDITGKETARTDIIPEIDIVRDALGAFMGDIMQTPPAFSAVHVNGARAYNLARRGVLPDIPPRNVTIYSLDFTGRVGASWRFKMRCSRGTYVRSVARDLALRCGTIATVDMIRRTQANGFLVENAVKLDFLEKLVNNGADIGQYLMPVDLGLGDIPVINLRDGDADLYIHGGFIGVARGDGLARVYNGEKFIGIGVILDGTLRPKRTI